MVDLSTIEVGNNVKLRNGTIRTVLRRNGRELGGLIETAR